MALSIASRPKEQASFFWQKKAFRRGLTGWLCVLPIILYEFLWVILPISFAFVMVFTDWRGFEDLSKMTFVGLDNIRQLLSDQTYISAFMNTINYALVAVSGQVTIGLMLALALNQITRWMGFVRVIYYMPVILPGTAMALLWRLMYEPVFGFFNQTLMAVGLKPVPWLVDPNMALYSVCIYVIWKGVGWYMIMFLAGLKSIPTEYYEAAQIDGAGAWQRFTSITIPLLKPTLLFVTVMAGIGSLQVFDSVFMMTGGGPVGSTTTVVLHMYNTAFNFFQTSYATAMAVGLFIIILLITRLQIRLYGEGGMRSYYS